MNNFKHFLKLPISFLLIGLLWFPLVVQFAHIFEEHEHKPCEDLTTHLHEKQLDCSLFDFHFSNYNYTVVTYPEFYSEVKPNNLEARYFSVEVNNATTPYFVRGPPSLS